MVNNNLCKQCYLKDECELECQAMVTLRKLCQEQNNAKKTELIKALSRELDLIDYEVDDYLKALGERVIVAMPELHVIRDYEVKVGYVRSYEAKRNYGKSILAECRKVNGPYKAYLPFDFIVVFYDPNIYHMTENQQKILMLHELKHIGMGEKGLKIENHDVEDFKDILFRYGIDWNSFNQDVPDILAGGGVEEENGRKRQKMASESGAGKTG